MTNAVLKLRYSGSKPNYISIKLCHHLVPNAIKKLNIIMKAEKTSLTLSYVFEENSFSNPHGCKK